MAGTPSKYAKLTEEHKVICEFKFTGYELLFLEDSDTNTCLTTL